MDKHLQDYISSNFKYEDGKVIRTVSKGNQKAGSELKGCINGKRKGEQYYATTLRHEGKRYKVFLHVVVFFLVNGYVPETVDHIDGDSLNNEPSNLRGATHKQNCQSRGTYRNSLTGYKGVSYHKATGKYRAVLANKHLGVFDTPKEAAQVYNEKALTEFGEFAKLNIIK